MELSIYADCTELINNFANSGDCSFRSFCEQWKKMKMQNIFLVQTSHIEVINTVQAILHVAKRALCGQNFHGDFSQKNTLSDRRNMLTRIAGLYLMYTIYFKQPTEKFVKITVRKKTWKEIQDFFKSVPITDQFGQEVRFIFTLLVKNNSFQFTASDYNVGLENLIKYDIRHTDLTKKDEHYLFNNNKLRKDLPSLQIIQNTLPAMVKLETNYDLLKKKINNNIAIKIENSPESHSPNINIFQNINKVFQTISNILAEPMKSKLKNADAAMESSDESDNDNNNTKKQATVKKSQTMHALEIYDESISEEPNSNVSDNVQTEQHTKHSIQYQSLAMLLEEVLDE